MSDQSTRCSRSGRIIQPHETAFVVEGQVVCREVHDELRPACPYCHADLPAKPASFSSCPHCGQTIIVRSNQDLFDTTILTREQSDEFDRIDAIVRPFKPFGLSARDYVRMKDKLREEMELEGDASDEQIVWQFFHEGARRIEAQHGDSPAARRMLADLYALQARFVHAQGKDHRPIQYKWARTLLQAFKAGGVTQVRLQGIPDQCLPSRRLHGKVMPLEEALARPPIPCEDCNHRLIANEMCFRVDAQAPRLDRLQGARMRQAVNDRPFCECRYVPAEEVSIARPAGESGSAETHPGEDLLAGL